MKRLATMLVAACALMLTLVAIAPDEASAGWRRGYGYYGPGVGVYVGPGYGYYGYGYRPRYYGGYYPYAYYPYWRWPLLAAGLGLLAPDAKARRDFQGPFPAAGMALWLSRAQAAKR